MISIDVIKSDLKGMLSEYRYQHSLRVADVAFKLADIYKCDKEKAYLAGILHDLAKEFSEEEVREVLFRNGYYFSDAEIQNNRVIHSEVGALVAREKYGIEEEICHAILCHTLGDIPMNLLDKILFVADKIEPGKEYDGILEERELAFVDIDRALILCIENHHKKLKKDGKKIHPKSLKVLNYLKENTSIELL